MSLSRIFSSVVVCLSLGACTTILAAPSSGSRPVAPQHGEGTRRSAGSSAATG